MSQPTDIPKGYWQDANGALIPIDKIKAVDKARDKAVRTMVDQAQQMTGTLAAFKLAAMAEVEAFVALSAAEYGAKLGGKKGNITLTSFDGSLKVIRAMQDSMAFDERLQVAKSLIDECVHAWAKGASKNIQALVNHAFQVDTQGQVNIGRVLGLRRLDIDDPKWRQAMEAIGASMKTVSSKAYIRFYRRDDASGEFRPIALDVSAL
jgi:hypothetical protein